MEKEKKMARVWQTKDVHVWGLGLGQLFPNRSWYDGKYLN
jgi:hypothetical protein